jgi:hypothetical protein
MYENNVINKINSVCHSAGRSALLVYTQHLNTSHVHHRSNYTAIDLILDSDNIESANSLIGHNTNNNPQTQVTILF